MNAKQLYVAFSAEIAELQGQAVEAGAAEHPELSNPERKRRLSYVRARLETVMSLARRLNLSEEMLGVPVLDELYQAGVDARMKGTKR